MALRVLLCLALCPLLAIGQESADTTTSDTANAWKAGGVGNLNFNQVTLKNWAAGGEDAVSLTGIVNLFANHKRGTATWDNTIDLTYGIIKPGKQDFIKNDDRIDLNSKFGKKSFLKNWNYSVLLNFKSQFAPGYKYPNDSVITSDFLAPGYFVTALGMDFMPSDNLTVFVAPITSKITFVQNQLLANDGAFGVEAAVMDTDGNVLTPGQTMRNEPGSYIRTSFKADISKNITLQTKLDLFSSYLNNPGNIDVNWENLITFKVNKYISASISTLLIYDDDIDVPVDTDGDNIADTTGPRTQFKEAIGLGLSYKF